MKVLQSHPWRVLYLVFLPPSIALVVLGATLDGGSHPGVTVGGILLELVAPIGGRAGLWVAMRQRELMVGQSTQP